MYLYFIITVFCQFCNSALYSENKRYVLLKKKFPLVLYILYVCTESISLRSTLIYVSKQLVATVQVHQNVVIFTLLTKSNLSCTLGEERNPKVEKKIQFFLFSAFVLLCRKHLLRLTIFFSEIYQYGFLKIQNFI